MFSLMQDLRAASGASAATAVARWMARWKRWQGGAAARRAATRAGAAQARVVTAAHEACAVEGATTEFDVVVFDGRRYGALYVDGKLNCLLPDLERL